MFVVDFDDDSFWVSAIGGKDGRAGWACTKPKHHSYASEH